MPSHLEYETLRYVSNLMTNIIPVSKANIFGVAGLVIVSIGILLLIQRGIKNNIETIFSVSLSIQNMKLADSWCHSIAQQ